MNSHLPDQGCASTGRFSAALLLLCLGLMTTVLCSGCARMKQYSIDSWQGPLPISDVKYVEAGR
jgi:hypothetical protein